MDVSVFGPFQSYIQKEVHYISQNTGCLDAFSIADILTVALSEGCIVLNVWSVFRKSGCWKFSLNKPTKKRLENVSFYPTSSGDGLIIIQLTLQSLFATLKTEVDLFFDLGLSI